ncbi:ABC transporter permease [Sporosalibacterium faouarense]|uniref:ABC transporter permease n=1 Tax=Sporosalibacterium faouarense TaxID=516123 RepID=UPI00192C6E5B|nr:ABC transporter permease [Sporosalibacterium faouarense]
MKGSRTYSIFIKEIYEIKRDPYTLGIAIIMPLILLFLFGYALNLDVKNISTAVLDHDKSLQSRKYIERIKSSGYFDIKYHVSSYKDIEKLLDKGYIRNGIVVPSNFSKQIIRGLPTEVGIFIDGTFPPTAKVTIGYIEAINEKYSGDILKEILRRQGRDFDSIQAVKLEERVWYNPSLKSKNFIIPGLFAVILMAFPPLLSTLAIVREKEKGSIQQIFVSPTKPFEFIIGKTIPYALIAIVEMVIILIVGVYWFKVPFKGSLILFIILGTIYVFCTVSIGVLVSTMMKSQMAAMLLVLVITVMPSLLFSGFIYPIFNMPIFFKVYTYLFPARFFIDISRDILLKGNNIKEMFWNIIILLLYTTIIISIASLRFKKKVD